MRAMALCLLLALLPALALADRFAVIKGGQLHLRQYPSTSSYSLGKYATGTWVIAGTESDGWCEVKTLNGKRGYMMSEFLLREESESTEGNVTIMLSKSVAKALAEALNGMT